MPEYDRKKVGDLLEQYIELDKQANIQRYHAQALYQSIMRECPWHRGDLIEMPDGRQFAITTIERWSMSDYPSLTGPICYEANLAPITQQGKAGYYNHRSAYLLPNAHKIVGKVDVSEL